MNCMDKNVYRFLKSRFQFASKISKKGQVLYAKFAFRKSFLAKQKRLRIVKKNKIAKAKAEKNKSDGQRQEEQLLRLEKFNPSQDLLELWGGYQKFQPLNRPTIFNFIFQATACLQNHAIPWCEVEYFSDLEKGLSLLQFSRLCTEKWYSGNYNFSDSRPYGKMSIAKIYQVEDYSDANLEKCQTNAELLFKKRFYARLRNNPDAEKFIKDVVETTARKPIFIIVEFKNPIYLNSQHFLEYQEHLENMCKL